MKEKEMKIIHILFIIYLRFPVISQPINEIEKSILEAQDSRNVSEIKKLYDNGELNEDKYLKRALIALANIADTSYENVKVIMDIYQRPKEKGNIEVQSAAIFALGQIPCSESLIFLRKMEESENNDFVFNRTKIAANVLNSLGKIGNEAVLERIWRIET